MLNPIGLDISSYGIEVRESALADMLEWWAIFKKCPTEDDLADFVADCDWTRFSPEPFHMACSDGEAREEEDEDPDHADVPGIRWAELAFNEVNERRRILGEKYPFKYEDGRLVYVGPGDLLVEYIGLLAISTSHAMKMEVAVNEENLFEDVVANVLKARGLLTSQMAAIRRSGRGFRGALEISSEEVALKAVPENATFKEQAHDEGVDILVNLYWGDNRPGQWVFLGQVTCGESGTWVRKSKEPPVGQWRNALGMINNPHTFLAVPHHVPNRMLEYMVPKNEEGMVLDRLKICHTKDGLLVDEKRLIGEVKEKLQNLAERS